MDDIDLKLSILLSENSRTPYRKLADEVNLSVNAVHSRVQNMVDLRIIEEFYAKISLKVFKGSALIWVEGKSEIENLNEILDKLGEDKNIFKVVSASGNYLYVEGLLRDISEINEYTNRVREKAKIRQPKVFIPVNEREEIPNDFKLSNIDYKIIYALHKDSRKALSEVASEIGVSAKTVRRRLQHMEDAGAIELGIKMKPTRSSDFISFFSMEVKPVYDRKKVLYSIRKNYFPNVNDIYMASNEPNRGLVNTWAKTLEEIHSLKEDLRDEGYFESIRSQIFYGGETFDTWRDDVLKERATD